MAGPLAQSAERGADNAKVVSSTLTRTKQREFFLLLNILFSAQVNLFFFKFFFDFNVMVAINLHKGHLFHIPHLTDTARVSQGR